MAVHQGAGPADPPLVERDRELAAIAAFARAPRGTLIVEGAAGTGKTVLLQRLAAQAHGARRARASECERDAPLALARRLGGPAETPALVVVDDAQWADPDSLRRIAGLDVPVAVALRSDEPAGSRFDRSGATVLRLAPLTPDGIATLVRDAHPDAGDDATARIAELSAGNPWLVVELLAAGLGADGVPDSVRRRTRLALERLGAGERALAEAVAVLGPAPRVLAAEVAGLPDAQAHAGLVARAILAPGEPARFEQPLVGAAVAESIPPFARARLHRRAAAVLARAGAGDGRVADQLLLASRDGDPWTVGLLRRTAAQAVADGAPGRAARLLRRAAAEPPGRGEYDAVLVELARAEVLAGDPGAYERFAAALGRASEPADRADAWHELSRLLWARGDFAGAATAARRGRVDVGPAGERLLADELAAAATLPELAAVAAEETDRLVAGVEAGRPPRDPTLLAHIVVHLGWRGVHVDRIPALARAAVATDPLVDPRALGVPVLYVASGLSWVDEIDASAAVLDAALASAAELGDAVAVDNLRVTRAWQHYYAGELGSALALLEEVASGHRAWKANSALAASALAQTRLELGDLPGARAAIALGDPSSPDHAWSQGRVELEEGDARAAMASFTAVGQVLEERFELGNPAIVPWRSEAALAALRLGDADRARALAAAELARAREMGNPRAEGAALRASGLAAGGAAGLAQLEEAVATLERSQTRIELLRALVDLGAAQRRAGSRGAAAVTLRRAVDLAAAFGALAMGAHAAAELALCERRDPARVLTPAERRAAELAAAGSTTREIARRLHVSPRTIESQLASVYRKLGVASRRDLADRMPQA